MTDPSAILCLEELYQSHLITPWNRACSKQPLQFLFPEFLLSHRASS